MKGITIMKNEIRYVSEYEICELKKKLSDDTFVVEIDGALIQSEEDYVREMITKFQVPYELPPKMVLGWYFDDITDLLWIKENKIVVIIHNFNMMLSGYEDVKQDIIDDFRDITLPWWDGEVVGHMVGGYPRSFMVYLEV